MKTKNNQNKRLQEMLRETPDPTKGWEQNMVRQIVQEPQSHRIVLLQLWDRLTTQFYNNPVMAPALGILCLSLVGLWNPASYYQASTAASTREQAMTYVEEITYVNEDADSPDIIEASEEEIFGWIPDY